jgi:hypothetical protein
MFHKKIEYHTLNSVDLQLLNDNTVLISRTPLHM